MIVSDSLSTRSHKADVDPILSFYRGRIARYLLVCCTVGHSKPLMTHQNLVIPVLDYDPGPCKRVKGTKCGRKDLN